MSWLTVLEKPGRGSPSRTGLSVVFMALSDELPLSCNSANDGQCRCTDNGDIADDGRSEN